MTATPRPAGARSIASAITALAITACAPASDADDPDVVPPVLGQDAIEAWFDAGHYLRWTCESAAHDAPAPSPHGRVRLCANPIATSDASGAGTGVDRIDAAVVLEILDDAGQIAGRGAQRHTRDGADAEAWYWYMHVPPASATVHDAGGLAADGWGFEGPPATYCGDCHRAAGATQPGHDFVFVVP